MLPGGSGGLTGRSRIFEYRIFDFRLSLAVEVPALQAVGEDQVPGAAAELFGFALIFGLCFGVHQGDLGDGDDHFSLQRLLEHPAIQGAVDLFDEGSKFDFGDEYLLSGRARGSARQRFGVGSVTVAESCDDCAIYPTICPAIHPAMGVLILREI
jgi:hypothetical protein